LSTAAITDNISDQFITHFYAMMNSDGISHSMHRDPFLSARA